MVAREAAYKFVTEAVRDATLALAYYSRNKEWVIAGNWYAVLLDWNKLLGAIQEEQKEKNTLALAKKEEQAKAKAAAHQEEQRCAQTQAIRVQETVTVTPFEAGRKSDLSRQVKPRRYEPKKPKRDPNAVKQQVQKKKTNAQFDSWLNGTWEHTQSGSKTKLTAFRKGQGLEVVGGILFCTVRSKVIIE